MQNSSKKRLERDPAAVARTKINTVLCRSNNSIMNLVYIAAKQLSSEDLWYAHVEVFWAVK